MCQERTRVTEARHGSIINTCARGWRDVSEYSRLRFRHDESLCRKDDVVRGEL